MDFWRAFKIAFGLVFGAGSALFLLFWIFVFVRVFLG